MLRLYNTLLAPLRALLPLWAKLSARDPERAEEWSERLVRHLPSISPGSVWIHGASVGEARIVGGLARELRRRRPGLPIAVSAFTRTGRRQLPGAPDAQAAFFLPADLPGYPARLIRALRPATLVLIETELWPNLIAESERCGLPVMVLNGRLSPQRMKRYRRLRGLYGPCLRRLARLGAQTAADAQRFCELGLAPTAIEVTGNIKYDLAVPGGEAGDWRRRLGLPIQRPVWVAGSTGPGEELPVLDAFDVARRSAGELFLVLAPRHPPRADEVASLLRKRGIGFERLSAVAVADPGVGKRDCLLVDTLGDLGQLYRLASVAFVGGSLVPVGGHNLLEPATVGAPVLFGPYTDQVTEMAEDLENERAGRRVRDADELGRAVAELVEHRDRGRAMAEAAGRVLERNRGALARSVDLALSVLDRHAASRSEA